MGECGRHVPIQTLQDAIRYGEAMSDPRGSYATMYLYYYLNFPTSKSGINT